MSGDITLGRLIDPPAYTVTVSGDDMAGILNIVEEALMRTDDFIDMDYGSYLRDGTRAALERRREDIRGLLARLIASTSEAEAAAYATLEVADDDRS